MFHKNKVGSIIRSTGTVFNSLLHLNSRQGFNGLKYMYSVILVIVNSLPGNTKSRESTRSWTAISPFLGGIASLLVHCIFAHSLHLCSFIASLLLRCIFALALLLCSFIASLLFLQVRPIIRGSCAKRQKDTHTIQDGQDLFRHRRRCNVRQNWAVFLGGKEGGKSKYLKYLMLMYKCVCMYTYAYV